MTEPIEAHLPEEPDLRRQRAYYEDILNNLPVDIAVFDVELRYEFVNATAVKDPAVRAWMVGRNDLEYCQERGKPMEVARERMRWMRRAVEAAEAVEFEETLTGPEGEPKHIIRRISPVVGADGAVLRLIGFGFDITARKIAEQALRQQEEELRQSKKLETVGHLAGGIAHDFNNLLTAIQGNAQLLLEQTSTADAHRVELEEISRAADRAAALTRQLLAFSRKQVLQPTTLDLNAVIRDMQTMLLRLVSEKIELRLELQPRLWTVRADRGQLEQVILNLALNARDAMPHGGTLTIGTRNVPRHDKPEQRLGTQDCALLTISDTGGGMDEPTRQRAFEPFFTTKAPGKGTGLGLSTVYGIVEQSGGQVTLESGLGRGTCIEVCLPRTDQPAEAASDATRAATNGAGTGTILLVEDEKQVRALVKRILERNGYTVLEAPDAEAALVLARQHAGGIDLLLSDIVMPGLDGPQLYEKLRRLRNDLPAIFMSGYSDDAIAQQGVLNPDTAFIGKPFLTEDLLQKVREALAPRPGRA